MTNRNLGVCRQIRASASACYSRQLQRLMASPGTRVSSGSLSVIFLLARTSAYNRLSLNKYVVLQKRTCEPKTNERSRILRVGWVESNSILDQMSQILELFFSMLMFALFTYLPQGRVDARKSTERG